jgi:acetyl esterase/lipase
MLFGALSITASAQSLGPRDVDKLPATRPVAVASYGADALEFGELRLPRGKGPFPVIAVIHGGCWTKGFATLRNTAPLASALTAMGYATWNIEYRQVGDSGGGWPGSFIDWARATDYLRELAKAYPLDLDRIGVIGHSAGAYAALWVAARPDVPPASDVFSQNPLPARVAVAIDGPTDLTTFVGPDAGICGKPVVVPLMGGTPAQVPQRYAIADLPASHHPAVREALIGAALLQAPSMTSYRAAGIRHGQTVDVLAVRNAGHFEPIAPTSDAWQAEVRPFLSKVLAVLKH